ncbi:MAG: molybdopterin cofactor-binding domain-containing protein, partial [Acidimicrobiia bacterium]
MTAPTVILPKVAGGIGSSEARPDGIPKVEGSFAYSSDLHREGMLWGGTLRSPHARARIARIETAPALTLTGVHAVLTIEDVPGRKLFGLEEPDQPVLADGEVRYWGEPVALVAADDPETARRAVAAIDIEYEELPPLVDPQKAERDESIFRRLRVRRGDPDARGHVVIEGFYQVGMQDQAPLGTESGLAIPDGEGGVDLHISTQWLHVDHQQVTASLGLRPEQVRLHLAGIGGAFGAREDCSLQIHLCLLALRTGRPVKMVYDRAESFVGHVHRHPALLWYRHEAHPDGRLARVEAKLLIDGGAYVSTSGSVIANATYFSVGPYRCPSVKVDGIAVRTNNPPCGAMRGFGAVQSCFGYEAQMDRLAEVLGMDPVELRLINALGPGDELATTGQVVEGSLPTSEDIQSLVSLPLPDESHSDDPRRLPGGTGLTTPRAAVRRGIGFAVGIKNLAFSEGFDDYAEARAVLTPEGVE